MCWHYTGPGSMLSHTVSYKLAFVALKHEVLCTWLCLTNMTFITDKKHSSKVAIGPAYIPLLRRTCQCMYRAAALCNVLHSPETREFWPALLNPPSIVYTIIKIVFCLLFVSKLCLSQIAPKDLLCFDKSACFHQANMCVPTPSEADQRRQTGCTCCRHRPK